MGEELYEHIMNHYEIPSEGEFLTIWEDFDCDNLLDYDQTRLCLTNTLIDNIIYDLWECIFVAAGLSIHLEDWNHKKKTVVLEKSENVDEVIYFIESHGWTVLNKAVVLVDSLKELGDLEYLNYFLNLQKKYTLEELKNIVENGRGVVQ